MKMSEKNVYIGTSGWSFNWDKFVEKDVKKSKKMDAHTEYFDAAEVNYSFYRLPGITTVNKWNKVLNEQSKISLKLSRYITHIKRLHPVKTPLKKFLRRYRRLGNHAGPILVQLPPNFKQDISVLEKFFKTAQEIKSELQINDLKLALEFRNQSWFENQHKTEDILKKYKVAWVWGHSSKYPYPEAEPVTSNEFIYYRLHGPGKLFASEYGEESLKEWADSIKKRSKTHDIYVYFNNDKHAYAAKDALTLKSILHE